MPTYYLKPLESESIKSSQGICILSSSPVVLMQSVRIKCYVIKYMIVSGKET